MMITSWRLSGCRRWWGEGEEKGYITTSLMPTQQLTVLAPSYHHRIPRTVIYVLRCLNSRVERKKKRAGMYSELLLSADPYPPKYVLPLGSVPPPPSRSCYVGVFLYARGGGGGRNACHVIGRACVRAYLGIKR